MQVNRKVNSRVIPQRSDLGLLNYDVFFKDINDIDIYVEDNKETTKKVYLKLFQRILGDKVKLENIYGQGGKLKVLHKYKQKQEMGERRKFVCIIDGDLDILISPRNSEKGLFVLPYYCIENLLLDENAILSIIKKENNESNQEILKEEFGFQSWKKEKTERLSELFILYAIASKNFGKSCPIKLTGYPVNSLYSQETNDICSIKLSSRITEVRNCILSKLTEDDLYNSISEIHNNISQLKIDYFDTISGKDYIFPLLILKINNHIGRRITKDSLSKGLAEYCNTDTFADVKNYIANI